MENLCRTCLRIQSELLCLFNDENLPSKIKFISDVEMYLDDRLPQKICTECIANVDLTFNFRNLIINNDIDLKERLKHLLPDNVGTNREISCESQKCREDQIEFEEEALEPGIFSDDSNGTLESEENISATNVKVDRVMRQKVNVKNEMQNSSNTIETKEVSATNAASKQESKLKAKTKVRRKDSNSTLKNGAQVSAINVETNLKEKLYRCTACNFNTSIYKEWRKHYKSIPHFINIGKPRECSDCKFSTADYKEWLKHKRIHVRSRSKLRECNICKFSATDFGEFQKHLKTHYEQHGYKVRECKKCDFKTVDFKEWSRHQKYHKDMEMGNPSVCSVCGKLVRSMWNHMFSHAPEPIKCDQCGKFLKNAKSLRVHERVHQGKVFKCKICGLGATYYSTLENHKRTHCTTDPRKVSCTQCEKRFFNNKALKKHMRSHTGERPYPCPHCPKHLSSKHALGNHLRQHTKEMPFICEYCSKAFRNKVSLRRHISSKHAEQIENTVQNSTK